MFSEDKGFDAEVRIPTTQYGYVHFHVEGTIDEVKAFHEEALRIFNGGEGISEVEFHQCLDRYLTEGTGELDVYTRMNKDQQMIIQAIKRSKKRIAYKSNKETV